MHVARAENIDCHRNIKPILCYTFSIRNVIVVTAAGGRIETYSNLFGVPIIKTVLSTYIHIYTASSKGPTFLILHSRPFERDVSPSLSFLHYSHLIPGHDNPIVRPACCSVGNCLVSLGGPGHDAALRVRTGR